MKYILQLIATIAIIIFLIIVFLWFVIWDFSFIKAWKETKEAATSKYYDQYPGVMYDNIFKYIWS